MRILFIGDIIGEAGRKTIARRLETVVDEYRINLVVANGENAAGGFGITPKIADELFDIGINVITSGNHIWDKKEIVPYLEKERKLLRPANYPEGVPGYGYTTAYTNSGDKVYEFRGEYQIVLDYMEPKGVGALLLAFEQLKERLSKEGLFNEARKRPIPAFPNRIGIVTSPTGAAIRDILKVIDRRFANVEIVIAPAAVQGERAAPEIVDAISELNKIEGIDVIIVTRGGGGIEDLWPFNEEIVARAIYNSNIPVISAVGHEIDYTIADFVADLRAPTPSAAAEMVVKNKEDIQRYIGILHQRLLYAKNAFFEKKRERIVSLSKMVFSPEREIGRYFQRLDEIETRIRHGIQRILRDRQHHIEKLIKDVNSYNPQNRVSMYRQKMETSGNSIFRNFSHIIALKKSEFQGVVARLDSLSPLAILSRGYSITYKLPERSIVKSSDDVQHGDKVEVKLHEGTISCLVEEV